MAICSFSFKQSRHRFVLALYGWYSLKIFHTKTGSSYENVFIQAASVYQEALKRAGYNHKLSYNNSDKCNSNNNNKNDNNNNNNNDNNNNNSNNNNKVTFNSNDNRSNNNNDNSNNNNNNNNNINSNDNNNPRTSKQRKRNIIWFNPPFSKNVATKIGRYFLFDFQQKQYKN